MLASMRSPLSFGICERALGVRARCDTWCELEIKVLVYDSGSAASAESLPGCFFNSDVEPEIKMLFAKFDGGFRGRRWPGLIRNCLKLADVKNRGVPLGSQRLTVARQSLIGKGAWGRTRNPNCAQGIIPYVVVICVDFDGYRVMLVQGCDSLLSRTVRFKAHG